MDNVKVPGLAWVIFSIGISIFMTCMGIGAISKDSISLEVARSKFEATKALNQARSASDEIKANLSQLEAKEAAYQALLEKYDELSRKHKTLKVLKPEIEQIDSIPKIETELIEKRLQETDKGISEKLDNL